MSPADLNADTDTNDHTDIETDIDSGIVSGIDPRAEAGALVASARALVAELSEEGLCDFEKQPLPEIKADSGSASPSPSRTRPSPVREMQEQPEGAASNPPRPTSRPSIVSPSPRPAGVGEAVPWQDRRPTLDEVRTHLGDCERCGLCRDRRTIVFGDGNPKADLMFIGEGPGEQEDRQGLPFVGRAGELLTQMIEKGIGLSRSDVYICNIVKCRPPKNRNPLPPEVGACRPFLDGQIAAIAPKVIVTLGKPAASLLLDRDVAITKLRGTWQEYRGIPLMPTLHPAYVLRQYTAENRRAVWQDLKAAVERSQS